MQYNVVNHVVFVFGVVQAERTTQVHQRSFWQAARTACIDVHVKPLPKDSKQKRSITLQPFKYTLKCTQITLGSIQFK